MTAFTKVKQWLTGGESQPTETEKLLLKKTDDLCAQIQSLEKVIIDRLNIPKPIFYRELPVIMTKEQFLSYKKEPLSLYEQLMKRGSIEGFACHGKYSYNTIQNYIHRILDIESIGLDPCKDNS